MRQRIYYSRNGGRMTRRQLLKAGAVMAGGSLILPRRAWGTASAIPPLIDPNTVQKFVDPLPQPPLAKPVSKRHPTTFEIWMTETTSKFHRDFGTTRCFGYNNMYLGPTMIAVSGVPVTVNWINNVETSFLPDPVYDASLMGCSPGDYFVPPANVPKIRAVTHLHGGHVPPEVDGYPEDWIGMYENATYTYPNNQPAASLWYHDHSIGMTRLNVYFGMAAVWVITDAVEASLNLPGGKYALALVLQDRMFKTDGDFFYPTFEQLRVFDPTLLPRPGHPGPWIPEFFGNIMTVNGKVWPYQNVEPRRYRFRIYNGSNARFYHLSLANATGHNLTFYQIAAEQGFFPGVVPANDILMGPGERADVIIDFTGLKPGDRYVLFNSATAPFPSGNPPDANQSVIMQFRVVKPAKGTPPDTSSTIAQIDARLPDAVPLSPTVERYMTLEEIVDANDNPLMVMLNGRDWEGRFPDKLADAEHVKLGTTELWNFVNLTGDAHPMHLHLVSFQVVGRIPLDVAGYQAALDVYRANGGKGALPKADTLPFLDLANARGPEPNELLAPKDTVKAYPGEVTQIAAKFSDYTGSYPWHCHIVDHEDNSMMVQFVVDP